MNKDDSMPFELREAEEIPKSTNDWFFLRGIALALTSITITAWIGEELMTSKVTSDWMYWLLLIAATCDYVFMRKNNRIGGFLRRRS